MAKDNRLCAELEAALSLEAKGQAFYEEAIVAARLEPAKKIFALLRDEEVGHQTRIRKIYDLINEGKPWCEEDCEVTPLPSDPRQVFISMTKQLGAKIKPDTKDVEALAVGIALENESIKFYQDQSQKTSAGVEKEFFRRLVAEERSHHQVLADMKLYLSDPSSWFREKEKGGLDGA